MIMAELIQAASKRHFFRKHIEPWAGLLMQDIERAKSGVFFVPVGTIGRHFLEIESQAFSMDGAV